jgi:hypothetical protein
MKQLLSIFLVILFAFPAWAQEGVITQIQKGKRAPFTGILMDTKAAAKVLTDQKYTAEECKIEMDRELEILRAKLELDLKISEIKLNSANEKYTSLLNIKDEENKRLQELALKSPNDYSHWWFAGGVIGGIVLSVSIFAVAVEIKN